MQISAVFFSFFLLGRCLGSPVVPEDLSRRVEYQRILRNIETKEDIEDRHKEKTWCDPVLGCLTINNDWYSIHRPINVLPYKRERIDTKFLLHTREEPNEHNNYIVSADNLYSLAHSSFDPKKPTKFIVHGFVNRGRTPWLKEMAQGLLKQGDYNVIRVGWGPGSQPLYYQAAANSRVVGLEISHFVNTLITTMDLDPATVHCIGHSLGGHACGYAGEEIDKMGRITGLDPAGPYFSNTPPFIHLDPTDAMFVDVIHTDCDSIFLLGYGTEMPMGHLDFYPNSGHDQPGCNPVSISIETITGHFVEGGSDMIACSHARAIEFFIDSLDTEASCLFTAHECENYKAFEEGTCYACGDDNGHCVVMGIRADEYAFKTRENVHFYLDTDEKEPFCTQHYEMRFRTAKPKGAEKWVIGKIFLWLYGDTDEVITKLKITDDHRRMHHGEVETIMFTTPIDVGHVTKMDLKWDYNDNIANPGTYCWSLFCNRNLYVDSVEVSLINHYPESERLQFTYLTCSDNGETTEIKDKHTKTFTVNENCLAIE